MTDSSSTTNKLMATSLGNIFGQSRPFQSSSAASSSSSLLQDRKNILSAFTGLDLQLDSNGQVVSASRLLIEKKQAQKEQQAVSKEASSTKPAAPVTALTQALSSFSSEVQDCAWTAKALKGPKKGRKAQLSRKAKARKQKGRDRAENYKNHLASTLVKKEKRKQDKDRRLASLGSNRTIY